MFENRVVAFPVEIIRTRDGEFVAPNIIALIQKHDAIGTWIRKRSQQNRIHHTKDRRVCTDPERERQHCNRSKRRLFASMRVA